MRPFLDELCEALRLGLVGAFCEQLEAELKTTPRWRFLRRFHIEHQLRWARCIAKAYGERIDMVVAQIAVAYGGRGRP